MEITVKKSVAEEIQEIQKSLTWSGHKLQGRTTFNGLNISIENKKGSVRRGVDSDGHKWETKMHFDYGYIRGTEGVDGDHLDCVSPNTKILMADYTQKSAKDIMSGDELIGISLETSKNTQRKHIKTKVQEVRQGKQVMYRFFLDNGNSIETTSGHLHYKYKGASRDKVWCRADELKIGDRLVSLFKPINILVSDDYKIGYLYGAYLGDGSYNYNAQKTMFCDIAKGVDFISVIQRCKKFWNELGIETANIKIFNSFQTKTPVECDRIIKSTMKIAKLSIRGRFKVQETESIITKTKLDSFEWCRGFLAGIYDTDGCLNKRHELSICQTKNQKNTFAIISTAMKKLGFDSSASGNDIRLNTHFFADNAALEFTQMIQPSLEKKRNFLGHSYRFESVKIVRIERYEGDFVAIQTESKTYIANGLVTHNCHIGDNENAEYVYIIHQNNPDTNEYDEDKCMLGFNTLADAKEAYLSQYDRPGFLGKIDVMEFEKFKDYVLSKNHHGKRIMAKSMNISEYMKSVKKSFNFDMMKNLGI